jgi:hypothetical protein
MSVLSVKMDSPLLMDTASHVLTVVRHVPQQMELNQTNVKAVTLVLD